MQRNSVLPSHTETTISDVFEVSDLPFDLAIWQTAALVMYL